MGNAYATPENELGYVPDLHISGTIPNGIRGGLNFYLCRPRPEGISFDSWDKQNQERWDRIFSMEVGDEGKVCNDSSSKRTPV